MSIEKHIEEIYEVLTRDCDTSCIECKFDRLDLCVPHHKAEALYNAGYRKQSEVIRCKDCEYFKEYTTEYMQRVEKANGDCHLRLINCCLGGEQFCGCKYDDFCSLAKRR